MARYTLPTIGDGTGGTVTPSAFQTALAAFLAAGNNAFEATELVDARGQRVAVIPAKSPKLVVTQDATGRQFWSVSNDPAAIAVVDEPGVNVTMDPPLFHLSTDDGVTAYYGCPGADIVSATGTPTVDQLNAFPFWSGSGGSLDTIGFNVTTGGGAGSKARCGLYSSDPTTMKPSTLLFDGGEFDTTITGFKTTAISPVIQLAPRTLYYLAFTCGTAAPTVTTFTSGWHQFGRSATLAAQFGWVKSTGFTYGALPASFPVPNGFQTSAAALVVVKFKSVNR